MRYQQFVYLVWAVLSVATCSDETRLDITAPGDPDPDPIATAEDFEWQGVVVPGQDVEIKGLAGDIIARPAKGSAVEVLASKRGRTSDVTSVRIDVVRHSGGVTLCAVYPTWPGHPENDCRPGDQGVLNSHDNDVDVTFTVSVPAGVRLLAKSVVGNVRAEDLAGDVIARSVAGNIHLDVGGAAEAKTVAGSITAAIRTSDPGGNLEFASVTGDVSVEVPSDTNAYVEVNAIPGRLSSDFPLEATAIGRWEGTLGRGGPLLSLSTLNGSVALKRGR